MSMPEIAKYYGLCETCEHDATCMLRRSTQLKIIQCEEFSTQPVRRKTESVPDGSMPANPVEVSSVGICVNCANVATCGFPNARRGVQQCEEYVLGEAGVVPTKQAECSEPAA
jgi:hypothetical protein